VVNQDKGAVLITGASTGIGKACALLLDRSGYRVFAGVRQAQAGELLRTEGSERLSPIILDVTDGEKIARAVKTVTEAIGPDQGLTGLINNAGIVVSGPLEFLPINALRLQLEVNVIGLVAVTQAFLPLIRKDRGRIINIGSGSGRIVLPFLGAYCISKFATEAITDAFRRELKSWDIHVSIIAPGTVETPIWEKGYAEADKLMAELSTPAKEFYANTFSTGRKIMEKARRRSIGAEVVAKTIRKALEDRRPKICYVVGADAHMAAISNFLPDRLIDWVLIKVLPKLYSYLK